MNPKWNENDILVQTYTLKKILDTILSENALVDFDRWTKKLPAAHFDSEACLNASRRILKIRRISTKFSFDFKFIFQMYLVIENVLNKTKDLHVDEPFVVLDQLY